MCNTIAMDSNFGTNNGNVKILYLNISIFSDGIAFLYREVFLDAMEVAFSDGGFFLFY